MNSRRLSRDRLLVADVVETIASNRLFMSDYSASLFQDYADKIIIHEEYLALAEPGDYCFVEKEQLLQYEEKIESIILYKWNRHYPATTFFDLALADWTLCHATDFVGHSHEKITKEIYRK